jgi:hypothetical protein
MGTIAANWEDAETNRIVELSVEYTTTADRAEIERVTPTSVVFLDPATKHPRRKIGVWTRKGAEHLAKRIRQRGGIERVREQIAESVFADA